MTWRPGSLSRRSTLALRSEGGQNVRYRLRKYCLLDRRTFNMKAQHLLTCIQSVCIDESIHTYGLCVCDMCAYICVCVYTHMHIYIYIYTHIVRCTKKSMNQHSISTYDVCECRRACGAERALFSRTGRRSRSSQLRDSCPDSVTRRWISSYRNT